MKIRLVVTGRNYNTADSLPDELQLADSATLEDALKSIAARLGDEQLPPSCLIAVSGQHVGTLASHQPRELHDGDELVLIAPVAGG